MVLKERYFSRFEVMWYLEIAGEAIFLFELEKIGDETTQKKTQPPPWGDWVFWLSIDFKELKRYRAGENRWF
ncbi:MAG: hypothetical protein GPJ27_05885 [Microcystis aeruginosa L111-01]|jgi:hypothetical protein|nr:hypothetical protein [Microcystis aeruginosa W13-16]NCQ74503.1 hypothetical protein [Microcystis aeruginosa W13-13]NCQ78805.1 hypothetical protein [Microcystis aeruginosa W13-15]NCR21477.1 hypothetical protein [Microcystis aeruginosa L111-01]NCS44357.1 hypothetical protein [Microcystis aeruginosa BS11-05]NCS52831.1 hypothetical protein [Microcystis aeruginosa G13-05]